MGANALTDLSEHNCRRASMKTLLMITLLTLLPCGALAQEIYKWEDEKGVIHYDDKPNQPAAKPLEKDVVPYSKRLSGNLYAAAA
jgi:Domain of unknown function (DUF4124)